MSEVNCSNCKHIQVEAEIEPCGSCDAEYSNFEPIVIDEAECIVCPFAEATQCIDCTKDWDEVDETD